MKVGIVGVGLLGGSLGYILKQKQWASEVIGIGRNEKKLKKAIALKTIDSYELKIDENISDLDVLVLAVPVKLIPRFAEESLPYLKENAIITDVGSTKEWLTNEIEKKIKKSQKKVYFVGGHPMAGSEKTGVEALDPYLFENAVYVLTKTKNTNEFAYNRIKEMANILDANVLEMNAEEHDFAVASVSHLPHLIASSLVNCAGKLDNIENHILSLAAGGFRDTTRIASGSPVMWRDICTTNQKSILKVIDKFEIELNNFKKVILEKDENSIEELLLNGKEIRDKLPQKRKGIISSMLEIIVFVPDKPGIIGEIAYLLGKNNLNIKDIEVLHIRENVGGSIRVGLEPKKGDEELAKKLLENKGYKYKILN